MEQTDTDAKDFWVAALRAEALAFRTTVSELAPTAQVPPCPEWTVADLIIHLGRIYTWVPRVLAAGGEKAERPDLLAEGTDVLPWFDEQFAGLVAAFEAVEPEAPAWNWSTQPRIAGFWPRRMAHETAVHRWDAQMTVGLADPVEAKLAADGISEVLDTWLPGGRGVADNPGQGVVRLTANDVDRTWLIRLRPQGVMLLDESAVLDDAPDAQTGVGGSASDLLLALWGRLTPDVLLVEGDPARFAALRVG